MSVTIPDLVSGPLILRYDAVTRPRVGAIVVVRIIITVPKRSAAIDPNRIIGSRVVPVTNTITRTVNIIISRAYVLAESGPSISKNRTSPGTQREERRRVRWGGRGERNTRVRLYRNRNGFSA